MISEVNVGTFFVTFLVVSLVFLALASGVLLGRKPIAGSCGGKGDSIFSCKNPCDKRKERLKIEDEAG